MRCGILRHTAVFNNAVQHTAVFDNAVRRTAVFNNAVQHTATVKPRYYVQLGGRGFERYVIEKRYIASSLINRCKGLK